MKRLFYFLAVLFTAHYLLAKVPSQSDDGIGKNLEATNQVIGCRLQVVGSNQETACRKQGDNRLKAEGYRLEMPPQRQEMEDRRWKMEVKDQGCSFQKIKSSVINGVEYKDVDNQSSLLANDSAPISHLPSSSYYLGITPKLMMNPSSIEKGNKAIGEALGIFGRGEEIAEVLSVSKYSVNSSVEYARGSTDNQSDLEKAQAVAQVEAQRIIEEKRGEVEAAFARARAAKSESGWNTAKAVANEVSNYWNGVIEAIKEGRSPLALSQEEATLQTRCWMEKAGVAEVKALGISPCADGWDARRERSDAMMAMIKDKVWPFVSQAMKAFIEHPSEARMLAVRENASACACACACAYSYISAYAYATASDYATASASIYASATATAYAYAYAYADASASACSSSSVYAYAFVYAYASCSVSASASAYAYASVSASASEALEIASAADGVADDIKVLAEMSKKTFQPPGDHQVTMNFSISAIRETADFARAVAKYKIEQETKAHGAKPAPEWQTRIEAVFARARAAKNESTWREAGVAAKEVVTICHNENNQEAQRIGMNSEEVAQQQNYWAEQASLSEVKALETSRCTSKWDKRLERANAIMKMTREKFGSPVSPSMKEFMVHPSEATLKAIGKSALIAMSSVEAEEALEGAEVFAKASTDAAALAKKNSWNGRYQESINLSAAVTSEVAEFSRAVAAFKRAQESASASARF
ncbi:MAG TPA: hypothetical protein VJK54_02735 [Chthoniobacterales bacterium]|nr:hypothetical protein [Chthoniobacterales bacterium]